MHKDKGICTLGVQHLRSTSKATRFVGIYSVKVYE